MKFFHCLFLLLLSHSCAVYSQQIRLYSCTYKGGMYDVGTLFSVDSNGQDFRVEHHFDYVNGGECFGNSLLAIGDTILYGLADGGDKDEDNLYDGVLYSFNLRTNVYEAKHRFAKPEGRQPIDGLVQALDGKLYGVTYNGGPNNTNGGDGSIFSYDIANDSFEVVYYFQGDTTGSHPTNTFTVVDSILYGTTAAGGINGDGILFSFNPFNRQFKNVLNFSNLTGSRTSGALKYINGKLYGKNQAGAGNPTYYGNLYTYDIATGVYSIVLDFRLYGIGDSYGEMTLAADGKLYVTTRRSSNPNASINYAQGVLFSFDTATHVYQRLLTFDSTGVPPKYGQTPYTSVTQLPNGMMYGLTGYGGNDDEGVLYRYNPTTQKFDTLLMSFEASTTGSNPFTELTMVKLPKSLQVKEMPPALTALQAYPNPFTNVLNVHYFNASSGNSVTMQLADATGRIIVKEEMKNVARGQHTLRIDAANHKLTSGVYFLSLGTHKDAKQLSTKILYEPTVK